MESGLALKKADYEIELAEHLGYGGDPAAWTAGMTAKIGRYVKGGLAEFYYPNLGGSVYEWSFLTPNATLVLASGASELDLPDDFAGFVTDHLFVSTADEFGRKVSLGWGVRRNLAATPERTGPPVLAEVEVKRGTTPTEGTRYRLLVYPEADQAYTLQGLYRIDGQALSGARPYIYGGAAHSQTVKWAILGVAEIQEHNLPPQASPNWLMFQSRLQASVAQDRRLKPKSLGYNRDLSDGVGPYVSRRGRVGKWWDDVTIEGQAPS